MILLVFLFAATAAFPQIRNLRAGEDGRVYFTINMRLAGSDQRFLNKAFAASAAGVEALVESPRPQSSGLNPFSVSTLDVSYDGDVIAYTFAPICDPDPPCSIANDSEGIIQTKEGRILWRGFAISLRISPDGRYALASQPSGIFRIHIPSGEKELLAPGIGFTDFAIGANGAAVVPLTRELVYTSPARRVVLPAARLTWKMSRDGYHVAYLRSNSPQFVLQDMRTNVETELPAEPVTLGHDASRVILRTVDRSRGQDTYTLLDRVTNESCIVFQGSSSTQPQLELAPDGRTVFIASTMGIHRTACGVDLTPVLWLPVSFGPQSETAVPGSLISIVAGPILAPSAHSAPYPLPDRLAGFRVRLGQSFLPIEQIRPYCMDQTRVEIRAQIPWDFETPDAPLPISIETPQPSPFDSQFIGPRTLRVQSHSPQFPTTDEFIVEALHEDLTRPVTRTDPARPLETVHVFLAGLGAVDRPVTTGVPAPADPPAKPLTAISCDTFDPGGIVLAPGRIGLYRWIIKLPASMPSNAVVLRCGEATGVLPFRNLSQ